MRQIWKTLAIQRWDDHRYYHHSRINQSLHLLSACSFVFAYVLMFSDPAKAALIGWLVGMVSRQSGHFFFEPKGYDHVNQATHEYKEEIKVGYNLRRKVVLMVLWIMLPALLAADRTLFGLIEPAPGGAAGYWHDLGLLWLSLGIGGLLFRVLQLAFTQNLMTGVVWAMKILTDPFHDIYLYHRAPLALLRGELIDPMPHVH